MWRITEYPNGDNRLLEPAVGYFLGLTLILVGFWRVFPLRAAAGQIEQKLKKERIE
jgi:hypothetical protein